MAANLLESLREVITPELIGKAASTFGESEAAVSKGLGAAVPVLLSGLAQRSSDTDFASSMFRLVSDPANDGSLLGNIGGLLAPGATSSPMAALGGRLLEGLFGNNRGELGNALGGYAGTKASTGASLLNLAAPLVLSMLGKFVRSGNLNLSSLMSLLTGQKSAFASALPGPLAALDRYFAKPAATSYAAPPPPPPEPKSSIWRWLLPLLIILLLLWLLSRCMGRKEEPAPEVTSPTPAPQVESTPAPVPSPMPEPAPAAAATPSAVFYFDVDKFELPVAREGSLESVIEYLKANPSAMASISGFHDPTGDKAHNEELAKQRATTVRDAIMAGGVPESQIEMVKPVETTGGGDLEEARRVEVTVRP
jgi:outer membrane protein OmpA-like peptidoglycan-associated protein